MYIQYMECIGANSFSLKIFIYSGVGKQVIATYINLFLFLPVRVLPYFRHFETA